MTVDFYFLRYCNFFPNFNLSSLWGLDMKKYNRQTFIWIMLGFKKFFPLLNSIFMFNFIYLCVCAAYLSECKVGLWQKGFSGSYVNIFSGLRLCLICIFTGKSVHHWFWQMLFLTARCTRKACCISMTTGNCEMSSPVLAEKYLHSERAFKWSFKVIFLSLFGFYVSRCLQS